MAYTKKQLENEPMAELWEIAVQLGIDPSGKSNKEVIEAILKATEPSSK